MPRQSAGGMRPRRRVPNLSATMVAPEVEDLAEGAEAGAGLVIGSATAGAPRGATLAEALAPGPAGGP